LVQKIITRPWVSWIYENRRSMSSKKTTAKRPQDVARLS
jgi:hypothetical protein